MMFVFHYITRVEVSGDQQTGISQQGECVQCPDSLLEESQNDTETKLTFPICFPNGLS